MAKIIEKQLCYDITGLCFKVHRDLGRFCREVQYGDKLEELFKADRWDYEREYGVKNLAPDSPKGNKVDFVVKCRVLVDLKAKNYIRLVA